MKDYTIQLEDKNTITFKIYNSEGKDTGEVLKFNLDDVELPLKIQEIQERIKKSRINLSNQAKLIQSRPDKKGKKLMSANEEALMKLARDFFKEQAEIYNQFLGKDGVKKLLCGNPLGWTTLKKIDTIIEEKIMPELDVSMNNIMNEIKEIYKETEDDKILK